MVKEEIEAIVNQLPGHPVYITGDKAYQNLAGDDLDYTNGAVFLYRPLTVNDDIQGGGLQKSWPVLMLFAFKGELNDVPINYDPLMDKAFALSEQFLLRIQTYEDDQFRKFAKSIGKIKRTEAINVYDVNLYGWLTSFELVPFEYGPQCIQ